MKFLIVVALTLLVAVANGSPICAGCPIPMDMSEAEEVLKTAEAQLLKSGGPHYTFSNIHSATKQVVAGAKYSIDVDVIGADNKVELCNVIVLEQPWLDNTQVNVNCPSEAKVMLAGAPEQMAGAPESMDMQEAESVLKTAEAKMDTMQGPHITFSTIHSATKQIVAGVMYKINVDVVDAEKNVEVCDVTIFEQSWMGKMDIKIKCANGEEMSESFQSTKN